MTQKTLETAGSDIDKLANAQSLSKAITQHWSKETVSFHTPGHKGREKFVIGAELDVTELPGLDDFTYPQGILDKLNKSAADLFGARSSFFSVNGASAALMAAILAHSYLQKKILLPRNCHRSAINALILGGLEPVWYEPLWDEQWGVWTGPDLRDVEKLLLQNLEMLSCVLVHSIEYSGAATSLEGLARLCREKGVTLIVDEAHGTHKLKENALASGADIVVHSLHKTLGALTQTGLLHVGQSYSGDENKLKTSLNMVHTSSPSYVLLSSIEQALGVSTELEQRVAIVRELASRLEQSLLELGIEVFQGGQDKGKDELHLLCRVPQLEPQQLFDDLTRRGIYPETILGQGVLLLLGVGTTADDITATVEVFKELVQTRVLRNKSANFPKPEFQEQVLNPRDAWFMESEQVEIERAEGRIASDCIAPCPPGTPVLCPGQRIPRAIPTLLPEHRWLRVVTNPDRGDT